MFTLQNPRKLATAKINTYTVLGILIGIIETVCRTGYNVSVLLLTLNVFVLVYTINKIQKYVVQRKFNISSKNTN